MGQTASLNAIVFKPPNPPTYNEDLEGLFFITTNDPQKKIPAVFLKWVNKSTGEGTQFTILYSAGNAEDLGVTITWLKILRETLKVNVLGYDYTGYGLNKGVPSEKSCYDDINSVFSYLKDTENIPEEKILLYGKSLGTGPTLELAASLTPKKAFRSVSAMLSRKSTRSLNFADPTVASSIAPEGIGVAGIVLQSAMTSVLRIAGNNTSNPMVSDLFENVKKIDKIRCPVFLVHGTKDDVIPASHSKKLAEKTNRVWKYLELPEAGHWDIEVLHSEDFLDEFINLINYIAPELSANKEVYEAPSAIKNAPDVVVGNWLKTYELQSYTQQFLASGFFDMETIKLIEELDLELIGIPEEHRQKILQAVQELRQKDANTNTASTDASTSHSSSHKKKRNGSKSHKKKSRDPKSPEVQRLRKEDKGSRRRSTSMGNYQELSAISIPIAVTQGYNSDGIQLRDPGEVSWNDIRKCLQPLPGERASRKVPISRRKSTSSEVELSHLRRKIKSIEAELGDDETDDVEKPELATLI